MRWVLLLFLGVCVMVPIGFWFQANGNFRGRAKLEPYPKLKFERGAAVKVSSPIAVCRTKELCVEARRMHRRVREAKPRNVKEPILAKEWFDRLAEDIVFADEVHVVSTANLYFTEVTVTGGPRAGFQGFVYTVWLEEVGLEPGESTPKNSAYETAAP
jgi:hypothetical protein